MISAMNMGLVGIIYEIYGASFSVINYETRSAAEVVI